MQLKILGVYYTNSAVSKTIQEHGLYRIKLMTQKTPGADYICSVWDETPLIPKDKQQKSFFRNNGHLNIALQIQRMLLTTKGFNYVAFLEHDVLYHEDYLNALARNYQDGYDGISYRSYMGMNAKGYQKLVHKDEPMSMLSMTYDKAVALMREKIDYYIVNGSGCIEPDDKSKMLKVTGEDNVHVNMNETARSHHFTSHYNVYSKTHIYPVHSYWGPASNYSNFFN